MFFYEQEWFDKQWKVAENILSSCKVPTFLQKGVLKSLVMQVNEREILKYITPGNIVIFDKTINNNIKFPGAWFISNERIFLYNNLQKRLFEYPIEAFNLAEAKGSSLVPGKFVFESKDALITLVIPYKKGIFEQLRDLLNENINEAKTIIQKSTSPVPQNISVICPGCRSTHVIAANTPTICEWCRTPLVAN